MKIMLVYLSNIGLVQVDLSRISSKYLERNNNLLDTIIIAADHMLAINISKELQNLDLSLQTICNIILPLYSIMGSYGTFIIGALNNEQHIQNS